MTPTPRRPAPGVLAAIRRALTGRRNPAPDSTTTRNPRPDGLCAFGHALAATSPPPEPEQLHDVDDTTTT